jgi:membrane protease YdiL (CAAX protease family)
MTMAIVFSTPLQAGEEIGWRGFALPHLSRRLGLASASIVLGVIWASWHLPFFFIPGTDKSGQSFAVYLVTVTAVSVAMAWLFWRTNGSLLLTAFPRRVSCGVGDCGSSLGLRLVLSRANARPKTREE